MTYGVVLLLNSGSTTRAINLAHDYLDKAEDPTFALRPKHNIPHISMLHLELDAAGLAAAKEALEVFRGTKVGGSFGSVRAFGTWLFWLTARTPELDSLHALCVDIFAPLRSCPVEITWPMNERQQEMHRRHGYPSVLECFNPHITLGILRPEFNALNGGEVHSRWQASHLALAEIANRGRVVSILKRVSLDR